MSIDRRTEPPREVAPLPGRGNHPFPTLTSPFVPTRGRITSTPPRHDQAEPPTTALWKQQYLARLDQQALDAIPPKAAICASCLGSHTTVECDQDTFMRGWLEHQYGLGTSRGYPVGSPLTCERRIFERYVFNTLSPNHVRPIDVDFCIPARFVADKAVSLVFANDTLAFYNQPDYLLQSKRPYPISVVERSSRFAETNWSTILQRHTTSCP